MEEKRVTAMSFEEDDDFPEDVNKPESGQIPQKKEDSQNPHAASDSNSQLTGYPAKNPVQPEKSQDSKSAPASPAGNESESSAKLSASNSQPPRSENQQIPDSRQTRKTSQVLPKTCNPTEIGTNPKTATQEAQKAEKKKRVRKTEVERLQFMKEQRNKKLAIAAQKQKEAAILEQKIAWAEKSPEERRAYERDLDTHCKVLAGAIAINLFNSRNTKFDRESFKKILFDSLNRAEDISYFKKKLHD